MHAPAVSEPAWHVGEAIEGLSKMLSPVGIGLGRLTREPELDCGLRESPTTRSTASGTPTATPLWLQSAWPHASSDELLDCGEADDVFGQ